jgi:hypothetical protein
LHPDMVPVDMDLVVIEPPAHVEENPPVKHALSYLVNIAVLPHVEHSSGLAAPPAPPSSGHGGRRRRRWDSRSLEGSRSSSDGSLHWDDAPRPRDRGSRIQSGGGAGVQKVLVVASCSASKVAAPTTDAP